MADAVRVQVLVTINMTKEDLIDDRIPLVAGDHLYERAVEVVDRALNHSHVDGFDLKVNVTPFTSTARWEWDQVLETYNRRNRVLTGEILRGCTEERQAVLTAELDRNMAQLEELREVLGG